MDGTWMDACLMSHISNFTFHPHSIQQSTCAHMRRTQPKAHFCCLHTTHHQPINSPSPSCHSSPTPPSSPRMMRTMLKICIPEPRNTLSSIGWAGGRNTSPWTSFHPVSSNVSSYKRRGSGQISVRGTRRWNPVGSTGPLSL